MPISGDREFQAEGGSICRSPGARSCLESSKNVKRASEQGEVGGGRERTQSLWDHKDCCNDLGRTNIS